MRDVLEIETPRLLLRPLQMRDAPRVARFAGDPGVARMILRAPVPYLDVAAEGWIMTLRARAPLGEDFVFAADLNGEGLVGVIGAHKRPDDSFEIGYWFGRPHWGRGFASETLSAFVGQARKLGALQAGHFVDNPASGRVLAKNGFVYTGETEDAYSLGRNARAPIKRMRYGAGAQTHAAREQELVFH